MSAFPLDEEGAEFVERTYRRVKGIVAQQRDALERITAELQKRETIGREDLRRIMAEVEAERKPAVA